MRLRDALLFSVPVFLLTASFAAADQTNSDPVQRPVRFDRDVRPILSDKCFFCHGPDAENRQADLRLDLESKAKKDAIVAGDAKASPLIQRIISQDPDELMPPADSHKELSDQEIQLLSTWVKQGAPWSSHWAFTTPTRPPEPKHDNRWGSNSIDRFVHAKQVDAKLQPRQRASRETLIRRVSLDLTGLPPTIEQVDAFLNDKSDNAYEKLVDRLLQSHHYGQRMALMWLDAARYGDTSVYHADGPRDMWAWRDAIVKSYNDNMPFDQFSILQLAGDLMPEATLEQKVLAGFNRNNGTTDEGGAIAEEYRVEYAVDRVKTTSTVWMGLTMECAQCHDHKYDPISQEEYYKFFAFFNVSKDGGMQSRKGNAAPMVDIPDPAKTEKLPDIQKQLADARASLDKRAGEIDPEFKQWLAAAETAEDASLPSSGLLCHFELEEGVKRVAVDSVAPARKGKIKGKNTWVDTRGGKGLKFDGSNWVDLGDLGDFQRTDAFSYGGWVKPQKNGHGALLARMDDKNAFRGFDLLCGDNRIEVHIINTWPTNALKVTTKKALKADKWQHVFATYDGSSKASGVKVYVDGEEYEWKIEQDRLTDTIKTDKALQIGSRTPGSRIKGEIDEVMVFSRKLEQTEVQQLAGASPIKEILQIAANDRTDEQIQKLRKHYLNAIDKPYAKLSQRVAKLTATVSDLNKPLTSVMVMGDASKMRDTFILDRGAYDSPTDKKVEMGTMAALPPMRDDLPRNRLGLAKWLFQDDHPLTARVAVNRYWQLFFGRGLVSTPGDFGSQGAFPTHPDLLEWLAVDFRDNGWNIKRLVKQIVTSQTYQQSASAAEPLHRDDPHNELLARGPRFRLQGEFIRDSALYVSGLLVDKVGGPGVKPYQPTGLWAEVGLGGNPKFKQDNGDKLYRRSLYTYWKRSAPPPSMQIFDAPTREKCTVQRARTNTPLQALVTLNDVQFVEAARNFAQRIIIEGGDDNVPRIKFAFRSVTARVPTDDEVAVLEEVLVAASYQYEQDAEAAKKLVSLGESPRDESIGVSDHAAWTIVASAILNLDEALTRG